MSYAHEYAMLVAMYLGVECSMLLGTTSQFSKIGVPVFTSTVSLRILVAKCLSQYCVLNPLCLVLSGRHVKLKHTFLGRTWSLISAPLPLYGCHSLFNSLPATFTGMADTSGECSLNCWDQLSRSPLLSYSNPLILYCLTRPVWALTRHALMLPFRLTSSSREETGPCYFRG